MAEYRYTTENENIVKIQQALKDCSMGIGLAVLCDIKIKKGSESSTIIFKTKEEGKEINPMEFLSFGIIIGRDYKNLSKKKSRRQINIKLDFENDKFLTTEDTRELTENLLSTLKDALNEDRLIVQDVEIKSSMEINFDTIIIV